VCTAEEQCITIGSDGACMEEGCTDVSDCAPAPPTGNAPVVCQNIIGDPANDCWLDCGAGQTCPDGMECFLGLACAWPG
jgi:hypothetical protein